jgi:tRNA (cmo5U34)-methyltransferase
VTKSTADQIRARFDAEVERFSQLETGQQAAMDSPLMMEMFAQGAAAAAPGAQRLLDIGCGAGNYSLRLMAELPIEQITLVDLSPNMVARACERIHAQRPVFLNPMVADIRDVELHPAEHDIAVAAAVLHHLRAEDEWRSVFSAIYKTLAPGGSFWIADLVDHTPPALRQYMWQRYGQYLETLGGPEYRDKVFAYVEQEDTPRPVPFLLDQLRQAGFGTTEVLHKNGPFALLAGFKAAGNPVKSFKADSAGSKEQKRKR